MDEGQRVLERLARIDAFDPELAPPSQLLDEVRALLGEAETWVRTEAARSEPASDAVHSLRRALDSPVATS